GGARESACTGDVSCSRTGGFNAGSGAPGSGTGPGTGGAKTRGGGGTALPRPVAVRAHRRPAAAGVCHAGVVRTEVGALQWSPELGELRRHGLDEVLHADRRVRLRRRERRSPHAIADACARQLEPAGQEVPADLVGDRSPRWHVLAPDPQAVLRPG